MNTQHTIHTTGDSHAFSAKDPSLKGTNALISQHHLGPILCYSFGEEKLNRCDIRNFNMKDGDSIVFCFGEIDCRGHVHKHVTKNKTYQNVIDYIINNYFEAIKLNVLVSQIKLRNICVYSVAPAIQKHKVYEDPNFPYLGSDEERKSYVLYFNKKLKEKCIENDYVFLDVYDKYINENGFLRKDMSDGICHIKNKIYVKEFINNNKI